jgi:hypothetical protein
MTTLLTIAVAINSLITLAFICVLLRFMSLSTTLHEDQAKINRVTNSRLHQLEFSNHKLYDPQ